MADKDLSTAVLEELRGKDAADIVPGRVPEELKGKTAGELQKWVDVLDAHLRSLHQTDENELREKTVDEQKAFDYGLRLREMAIARIEEDRNIQEIFRRKPKAVVAAEFMASHSDDPFADVRRLNTAEARDRALRTLDDRNAAMHLKAEEKDEIERKLRRDTDIARRIIVTENEAYRSAWAKAMTYPDAAIYMTDEERQALRSFAEYRALSEGSTTGGGYGVPVFIDPSIILTGQGSANPFLSIARQVPIDTNVWKGVSSAGVTWSFDTEGSAVSDDSPTLAQPVVNVYTARGFVPYSIEVGQDYADFQGQVAGLLGSGYDELLLQKFSVGGGSASNEPTGIITALDADTTAEVLLTTAGSFGKVDFNKAWTSLPQRFRRGASWMMTVDVDEAIRAFVTEVTTTAVSAGFLDVLKGRPVYESPYFPGAVSGTSHQNVLVVGDFSHYVVARRGGMSTELVPTLFDVTNNRPTGQRGIFAYARIGGGPDSNAAFKLLNQT